MRLDELQGGVRRGVLRVLSGGTVLTAVGVTLAVEFLFGIGSGSSVVLGAILVVSGPTVVLPLLEFVRPPDRLRSVLKWEGVLVDPVGALLGVVAFTAVEELSPWRNGPQSGGRRDRGSDRRRCPVAPAERYSARRTATKRRGRAAHRDRRITMRQRCERLALPWRAQVWPCQRSERQAIRKVALREVPAGTHSIALSGPAKALAGAVIGSMHKYSSPGGAKICATW